MLQIITCRAIDVFSYILHLQIIMHDFASYSANNSFKSLYNSCCSRRYTVVDATYARQNRSVMFGSVLLHVQSGTDVAKHAYITTTTSKMLLQKCHEVQV